MPGAPISFHLSPKSSAEDGAVHPKDNNQRKKLWVVSFLFFIVLIFIIFIGRGKGDTFVSLPSPFSEFVGREEILKEVKYFLLSDNQNGLSIVALWGEGGMGKSETAIRFANQHLRKFSLIYWINTGSDEIYQQSYYNLAHELNITVDKKTPFERVREKVHMALENKKFRKPWLLIYDNADKAVVIPQRGKGKILITTRDKTEWELAKCIEMTPFSEKNALELYKKVVRADVVAREWPVLAKELDYYPLALSQALHFVKESPHFSVADYSSALEGNKNALLSHTSSVSRYPKNLLAIWQMNAKTIKLTYPHAYAWLEICACLHPDKIPISWLESWLIFENKTSKEEAKLEANQILRILVNQGHIRLSQDREYFSIHRLKQELIKLPQGHSEELSTRTLSFLSGLVKDYEFIESLEWSNADWGKLIDWEASAAWWLSKNVQCCDKAEDQLLLLNVMGNISTIVKERYSEGMVFYQRALGLQKNCKWQPEMVYTFLNQGVCLSLLAQYQQALDLSMEALRLTQHYPTKERARCLRCLGCRLNSKGESRKGVEYVEEALEILQSLYGTEVNVEICDNIKDLGGLLRCAGEYEKSIQFCLEALKMNRILFEEKENIQKCYILIVLGRVFYMIGEVDLALKCHLKAYRIEEKVFSSDSFLPITSLKEIAVDYCAKKRYSLSLHYTTKALRIAKEVYPQYLEASCIHLIANLGEIHLGLGKIQKAVSTFNEALQKLETLIENETHYLYFILYRNLGKAYCMQGSVDQGIAFLEKALDIQKKIFPEKQSHLCHILEDLIFACERVYPEKAAQYRSVLKDGESQSLSFEQRKIFTRECLEAI